MSKSEAIQHKLELLPTDPGVYLHKDKTGKVIYVGKANNLKHRVRSYFQDSRHLDIKTRMLVSQIVDFDYIVARSEKEALMLEMNLIKHYKPRYNIQLKDDKSFPYIKVTLNETYPRVYTTRKLENDGAKYYGPYTSATKLKHMLTTIKKLFPIRSCKETLPFPEHRRPCLDYYIKKCDAPCKGYISVADYQDMVKSICEFIEGRGDDIINYFKGKMERAAQKLDFEEAGRIRDQIEAMQKSIEQQRVTFADPFANWDILTYATDGDDACLTVLEIRGGKILGRPHYFLKGVRDESPGLIMAFGFHTHYDKATVLPDEVFVQHELEDGEDLAQWLAEKRGKKVTVHVPRRGEKMKLIRMGQKNAERLLEEQTLEKLKQKERAPDILLELQKRLYLKKVPRVIEGFDNSNIQGSDPVSSLVMFKNGKPYKSGYRQFKVKSVEGPDDFASMYEVITRRYRRLLDEGADFPDLILIDGGKGQLSAACKALQDLGVTDQDIIGLAKRLEEIFLPDQPEPIMIPKHSGALKVLQQVRDEAHRFAITFHRQLRGKRQIKSEMDDIPGIGEVKKFALLKAFGSVENIKNASVEEIAKVKGFRVKTAEKLKEQLSNCG